MKTSFVHRKAAFIIAVILVLSLLAGCSSSNQNQSQSTDKEVASSTQDNTATTDTGAKYTLRVAAASVAPSAEAVAIEQFKTLVESATDQITVETYPGSALGTNVQVIQGLQDGSVQGVCIPASFWESFCPEIGLVGLPMTFQGPEQLYQILSQEGTLNTLMADALASKGFIVGAWLRDCDSRLLSKTPVSKVADMKGMKVWCLANTKINDSMNALGATAVNFDTSDLAVGLEQGTVDAVFTGPTLLRSLKLYDSAKYLFINKVIINVNVLMLSKPWMDSLPPDLYDIVMNCAQQTGLWHYNYNTTALDDCMKEMTDNGVSVTNADDTFMEYAKQVTAPVIDKYRTSSDTCGAIYDAAIAAVAAYTGDVG